MAVDATRFSLTLSRRTRRRKLVNLLMQVLATIAALAAVAVLAVVSISVAQRGASALSWDFFTKTAATFGQSGGGVAERSRRHGRREPPGPGAGRATVRR